jgi:hypothetical protein
MGTVLRRSWREYPKELWKIALGLAPGMVLLFSFRKLLSPPSDIQFDAAAMARLFIAQRYSQVAYGFLDKLKAFGGWWNDGIHPATLVILYLLLYVGAIRKIRPASLHLAFVPVFMMMGYFMVYIITPYDLAWHLETSLDRLMMQIWPASVFILGAVLVTARDQTTVAPSVTGRSSFRLIRGGRSVVEQYQTEIQRRQSQ